MPKLCVECMEIFRLCIFYASSVTPHIWPWFPNSCLYLILEVFDIDLCSMECYFPRSRARKVTFRALGRGEWLSMLWDLGFCKCQHSQFTYSLLIKRNLTIFERVPLPQPGFELETFHIEGERLVCLFVTEATTIRCQDLLRTRKLCQSPINMSAT